MCKTIFQWAVAGLFLLACGDEPPAPSGVREPVPLENIAEEGARGICTFYRCQGQGFGALVSDAEACVQYWLGLDDQHAEFNRLRVAIEVGAIRYDGAAYARCLDSFEDDCDRDKLSKCMAAVFDGAVPAGGACHSNEACAGDALCNGEGDCGVCEAQPLPGEPCRFGFSCGADSTCVDGICVADATVEVELGEPCGPPDDLGGPTRKCPRGSWCDDGDFGAGIPSACVAFIDEGRPCRPNDRCADDAVCIPWEAGTCQRISLVNRVGERCDSTHTCNPFRRLSCNEGVCSSIGDGGSGTPCNAHTNPLGTGCLVGFECDTGGDGELGTCQVRPSECDSGEGCENGAVCMEGRCFPIDLCVE